MKKMLTLLLVATAFYCPAQTVQQVPLKTSYGIGSSLLNGFNSAAIFLNVSGNARRTQAISIVGVMSGLAGIVIGIINLKQDESVIINGTTISSTYHTQNNLSYVNIGIGTATMVTSLVNLALNTRPKNKKTALNVYASPGINNMLNAGLVLTRRM